MTVAHVAPITRADTPFRWTFVALEAFILIGALSGSAQLWTGSFAPPVEDLAPLGLDSWRLPAVWLFASVAVPSAAALVCALQRRRRTPDVVLVASGLLLVEVLVQIPFVGPSVLQAVMGGLAILLAALAASARRSGWRR
ncbi:MAG TPA: hypothetical protein VFL59_03165 [Candidatus Nanopelagicales bacterium]|nr:hypothetical protein [Candidatus Nanopelagicales bacterium]